MPSVHSGETCPSGPIWRGNCLEPCRKNHVPRQPSSLRDCAIQKPGRFQRMCSSANRALPRPREHGHSIPVLHRVSCSCQLGPSTAQIFSVIMAPFSVPLMMGRHCQMETPQVGPPSKSPGAVRGAVRGLGPVQSPAGRLISKRDLGGSWLAGQTDV